MASPPLTHHEIIRLVLPISKGGRHVDLAATDRLARRIVFKPADHPADNPAIGPVREVLALECGENATFRLVRTVSAGNLQASLSVRGGDPAILLRRIDAVAVATHFLADGGFAISRSFNLDETAGESADRLLFIRGEVRAGGVLLRLRVSEGRGAPAEIELLDQGGDPIDLPEDFLAVQGLAWTRLRRSGGGWSSSVRLRGTGFERSRDAQARLEQMASYLAHTLAEAPVHFHERWRVRRWGVYLGRLVPILGTIGVVSGLMILQAISWMGDAFTFVLMLIVPPLLFVAYFATGNVPGADKPPLPRSPGRSTWRGA